tara:strand:- start:225 stop:695 length:471 start_codon:yes stop_codon:yes gene_type:complete
MTILIRLAQIVYSVTKNSAIANRLIKLGGKIIKSTITKPKRITMDGLKKIEKVQAKADKAFFKATDRLGELATKTKTYKTLGEKKEALKLAGAAIAGGVVTQKVKADYGPEVKKAKEALKKRKKRKANEKATQNRETYFGKTGTTKIKKSYGIKNK